MNKIVSAIFNGEQAGLLSRRIALLIIFLLLLLVMLFFYPYVLAKPKTSLGLNAVENGIDIGLINQHDKKLRLSEFRGKPVILSFIFTGCSSYCSTQVVHLNLLRKKLNEIIGSDAFAMVSVSLTPLIDTPEAMLAYRNQFSIDANNWHFTTGDPEPINQLINIVGTKVKRTDDPSDLDHTTQVYVLNQEGKLASTHLGTPLDSRGLESVITTLAPNAQ